VGFVCYKKREKKAQSITAQNKNPYKLSYGGYRKLEKKIMSEKKKSRCHLSRAKILSLLHHHHAIKSGS